MVLGSFRSALCVAERREGTWRYDREGRACVRRWMEDVVGVGGTRVQGMYTWYGGRVCAAVDGWRMW
jgi:hypothetical protein